MTTHDGKPLTDADRATGTFRFDGPLILLGHSLDDDFASVYAKSYLGRFGATLEEGLRRIDQFSPADQSILLAALARRFGHTTKESQ